MNVLGLSWEFDTHWVSDVGTCEGRLLEWTLPKKSDNPVSFTLQCVDRQDKGKIICCVKMDDFSKGYIQTQRGVIKDQKGLDEMVTVAVSMMQRMRTKIRKEGAGAVGTDTEVDTEMDTDTAKTGFKASWQFGSLAAGVGA